jgi:murein DD-endopeptidase MepM/ murein hydrolase activator NlpD
MPHRSTAIRPRARRRRDPRLAGFLHLNKSQIALTAAALVALTTMVYSLPAEAQVYTQRHSVAKAQELVVAGGVAGGALTSVTRDSFSVSAEVQWPVPRDTTISSYFGFRVAPCAMCSTTHEGVDFTPGDGYPVRAIAAGVVREVGNPSGELGVFVVIDHVIDGVKVSSVYGHMRLGSLAVAVGDEITAGDELGLVGSTGQSTGSHLHFGILLDGLTPTDPLAWLKAHAL